MERWAFQIEETGRSWMEISSKTVICKNFREAKLFARFLSRINGGKCIRFVNVPNSIVNPCRYKGNYIIHVLEKLR